MPRRKISPGTVGKIYTTPDGKTSPADPGSYDYDRAARDALFRPSLFVTLTCPSYGRVGEDGTGTSRARRGARTGSVTAFSLRTPRPGLVPGRCKSKAHDSDHFGYAGRRVLASRKWSGKTLDDHRADREDCLLKTLGLSATDPARYVWEVVAPTDPDHMDHARRLLHAVADRVRWQAALAEARRRVEEAADDHSVNGRAA